METTPATAAEAAAIEAAEATAWADLYAAAPVAWARRAGVETRWIGRTLALSWAATGRRYFSRAIGLGVTEPATAAAIDSLLDHWRARGIDMFLVQSMPQCAPSQYEDWLSERGLKPFDAQDRVVRDDGEPASPMAEHPRELRVERVSRESATAWSGFLQRVYGLDTGPWLPELIRRPGWHQYVAREDGEIVGARGMYVGADGTAWLGMDGPVPGVMTDDYEPDAAICDYIVRDGPGRGARRFIADIEAPSERMDTPAYEYFARLGFRRPYVRTHWTTA